VEFSAEVIASLRLADGALVLVDSAEGIRAQTEAVLRAAIEQHVRPLLLINKCDKLFLTLREAPLEAADRLLRIAARVNEVICDAQKACGRAVGSDMRVSFEDNTIALGSGYFGWASSLGHFEHFIPRHDGTKAPLSTRAYLSRVLATLQQVHTAITCKDLVRVRKVLHTLALPRELAEDNTSPKEMMKAVMRAWLPAAENLLSMVVHGVTTTHTRTHAHTHTRTRTRTHTHTKTQSTHNTHNT
jgi:elongation factor 2